MNSITVYPPKMQVVGQALDIFGESRVRIGEWNEPVVIKDLKQDEVDFARKFFGELGFTVEVQKKTAAKDAVQEMIASPQATAFV